MILMIKEILAQKPIVGTASGFASLGAAILTVLHVLTLGVGFVATVFGALAAYYSYKNQRDWRRRNITGELPPDI